MTAAVVVIFALTYIGIALGHIPGLQINRAGIVLLGAIAISIASRQSTATIVGYVGWPTILLLFGFFIISAQLRLSGFFDAVAAALARRLEHPGRFLLLLMLVTAALSAVLNHDIVCFVFTPVVASTLLQRRLHPVPFLVGMAIASNIGSAATVIGNAQDMVIAQAAHLGFGHYTCWCAAPVVFAFASAYGLIWWLSRHRLALPVSAGEATPTPPQAQALDRAHTLKGLVILVLVVVALFTALPKELVALTAAGIHLASPKFRTEDLLALVDWQILIIFTGLFVLTGVFQASGCTEAVAAWLAHSGVHLSSLPVLALVTATLSNLINNSAAVMLLLKVVPLTHPTTAYVLALANSFGGSLLITGSVANIIVVQQAREMGIRIGILDFLRLGVPTTLVALAGLVGYLLLAPP